MHIIWSSYDGPSVRLGGVIVLFFAVLFARTLGRRCPNLQPRQNLRHNFDMKQTQDQ